MCERWNIGISKNETGRKNNSIAVYLGRFDLYIGLGVSTLKWFEGDLIFEVFWKFEQDLAVALWLKFWLRHII